MRPPRVKTHSFPPSIRRIYTSGPCSCRASSCFADLPTFVCLMRFLFVGSVVCRRLPSAHVSRRRPCLWLCAWRYLLHSGLAPIRTRSCRAHNRVGGAVTGRLLSHHRPYGSVGQPFGCFYGGFQCFTSIQMVGTRVPTTSNLSISENRW